MVGSGNLTFGGHGQDVEVLDVLSSRNNALAFADLALFLMRSGQNMTLQLPTTMYSADSPDAPDIMVRLE